MLNESGLTVTEQHQAINALWKEGHTYKCAARQVFRLLPCECHMLNIDQKPREGCNG
jgi:hypothetical protein